MISPGLNDMKLFTRCIPGYPPLQNGVNVWDVEKRLICPRLAVSSQVENSTDTKTIRIQVFASGQLWVGTEKN